jgi:hypothetical protein
MRCLPVRIIAGNWLDLPESSTDHFMNVQLSAPGSPLVPVASTTRARKRTRLVLPICGMLTANLS